MIVVVHIRLPITVTDLTKIRHYYQLANQQSQHHFQIQERKRNV